MNRVVSLLSVVGLVMLSLVAACGPPDSGGGVGDGEGAAGAGKAERSAPSLEELKNMTYSGLSVRSGMVRLTAGRWEGEPYGGAVRPVIELVDDFRLAGDLDGDGNDEAVVVLSESGGGSGVYTYVAVVARRDGGPKNLATEGLGDRVQIRGARIESGRLLLDLVRAGPGDAACCPGELIRRGWRLAADESLSPLVGSGVSGRLTLRTIAGTVWVLRAWDPGEPAPPEPEVTLTFRDGRFTGGGGCNLYNATATPGSQPGDVSVGPVGSTRRACSDPVMAVERRFLSQLGGVTRFGFRVGRLALSYERDGVWGVMLFDARVSEPGSAG